MGNSALSVLTDSSRVFAIDQPVASKLCAQAAHALASDRPQHAKDKAIAALIARPSCFQAYQLLGQYFDRIKQPGEAEPCYRGGLPESVVNDYFPLALPPVARVRLAQINEAARTDVSAQGTNGVYRIAVQPSQKYVLQAPLSVPSTVAGAVEYRDLARVKKDIVSEPCYVDVIANGVTWHDAHNTLVLDGEGSVVMDHSVGCSAIPHTLRDSCDPHCVGQRAVLLGARGAHNFYHWSVDIIPKLGLLKMAGIEIQKSDVFIVPFARSGFMVELLAVFGIKPEQVIQTEDMSPYLSAKELIVPKLTNRMGLSMGRWLPDFMRHSMVGRIEESVVTSRKIFISRQANSADGRVVDNQQEVENYFAACGFDIVIPEAVGVRAQAELFSQASVVAGVHGAGFTNLLYCAPGTKVIEFYGAHFAPCYRAISALAGLDYYNADFSNTNAESSASESASDALRSKSARRSGGLCVSMDTMAELLKMAEVLD